MRSQNPLTGSVAPWGVARFFRSSFSVGRQSRGVQLWASSNKRTNVPPSMTSIPNCFNWATMSAVNKS